MIDLIAIANKLVNDYEYTNASLNSSLITLAKNEDKNEKLDKALNQWLKGEEIDEVVINEVSLHQLINERFDPVPAILTMYWIEREPEEAKKFLAGRVDSLGSRSPILTGKIVEKQNSPHNRNSPMPWQP